MNRNFHLRSVKINGKFHSVDMIEFWSKIINQTNIDSSVDKIKTSQMRYSLSKIRNGSKIYSLKNCYAIKFDGIDIKIKRLNYQRSFLISLNPNHTKNYKHFLELVGEITNAKDVNHISISQIHLNLDLKIHPKIFNTHFFTINFKKSETRFENSIYFGGKNKRINIYDNHEKCKNRPKNSIRIEIRFKGNRNCPAKFIGELPQLQANQKIFNSIKFPKGYNDLKDCNYSDKEMKIFLNFTKERFVNSGSFNIAKATTSKILRNGRERNVLSQVLEKKCTGYYDLDKKFQTNIRHYFRENESLS